MRMIRIKENIIITISCLILFFFGIHSSAIIAQDSKNKDVSKVFFRIEEGIAGSAVDKFSVYFGGKNFLSLSNGTAGYYSANQSYYVIKDYLSIFQPTSFKFDNIVTDTSTPFASGNLRYNSNGVRGSAMVFVSLHFIDNQWRITQITIN